MLRVAVFVSGNGSNLQSLLDYQEQKKLKNAQIALVLSNKAKAYALKRAELHHIPSIAYEEEFETQALKALRDYEIDCIVLAGFMKILSPSFIRHYPNRIINIHPSLIPSFCGEGMYGLRVHQAALNYGVKISGASVHFVNEVVDGGKIIAQKSVQISSKETAQSLQKKVMQVEQKILPKALQILINQTLKDLNA